MIDPSTKQKAPTAVDNLQPGPWLIGFGDEHYSASQPADLRLGRSINHPIDAVPLCLSSEWERARELWTHLNVLNLDDGSFFDGVPDPCFCQEFRTGVMIDNTWEHNVGRLDQPAEPELDMTVDHGLRCTTTLPQ